jgi:hypothetical protein
MKDMKLKIATIAFAALFLLPNASSAATAVAVNDNTGLFVITFDFIAGKEDYLIPIGALHGLDHGASSTFAGYKIFSGDKEITDIVKSNGITLSKQQIVDNLYYKIEAGKRARFTTVLFAEVPENRVIGQYHAELSHLSYLNGDTRTQVAKDRVGSFSSDSILLNKNIAGQTLTLQSK